VGEAQRRWQQQAAERAAAAGGRATAEDQVLGALLSGERAQLAAAARTRAGAELIDQDYLAYWVDELGLRVEWHELERELSQHA
jgi:hypothetical protein